ncbi:hypothetical protein BP6252_01317 [Coleophoma cylindrospora]|uniref:2EXR domain-containing protein n=1 Tax=Coleophoma cylindrospora TaxID=1849047 RepID=A0A3D8SSM3_9HELO|nr:hypothetical protein BP6252_01317 [Coleophoma cylindrospora]
MLRYRLASVRINEAAVDVVSLGSGSPASESSSRPGNSFHLFNELPCELRLKIWDLAVLPRFVRVTWNERLNRFTSRTSRPALLYTSHEAREHALKTYQLCFAQSPELAKIYFSYDIDTVYFDWESIVDPHSWAYNKASLRGRIATEELHKIQRMAMHGIDLVAHRQTDYGRFGILNHFRNLKCVLCVEHLANGKPQEDRDGAAHLEELLNLLDTLRAVLKKDLDWSDIMDLVEIERRRNVERLWRFDGKELHCSVSKARDVRGQQMGPNCPWIFLTYRE